MLTYSASHSQAQLTLPQIMCEERILHKWTIPTYFARLIRYHTGFIMYQNCSVWQKFNFCMLCRKQKAQMSSTVNLKTDIFHMPCIFYHLRKEQHTLIP